jgi:BirA family biotin operon repressor/biotin-[acetyl-CoA-carboxylase] ligase
MQHPSQSPPTTDTRLLNLLLTGPARTNINQIASELQTTERQARERLARLAQAGCIFEPAAAGTVVLVGVGLGLWSDYLQEYAGRPDGRPRLIEVYGRTSSTQDAVGRMIDGFGPQADGALACADFQESGRGRLGRSWVSPPGKCLTFSLGLVDRSSAARVDTLMLAGAVAVAHALESLDGFPSDRLKIKWPNDILVDGRKLAGILVEQSYRPTTGVWASVVGIGINTCLETADLTGLPPSVAGRVTSLAMLYVSVHRLGLLARLVTLLEKYTQAADPDWLADQWRARSGQLGRRVTLICDARQVSGHVLDIDPRQGLILQSDQGPILHMPAATTSVVPDDQT